MEQKPLIVITMGDPAGVGPEIIAKVIDSGELSAICRPVVIGDAGVMKKVVEELRLSVRIREVSSPEDPTGGATRIGHAVLRLSLMYAGQSSWRLRERLTHWSPPPSTKQ
jgi:4-hydroxy-L-threonine phosphate dehydrogenase PdxA